MSTLRVLCTLTLSALLLIAVPAQAASLQDAGGPGLPVDCSGGIFLGTIIKQAPEDPVGAVFNSISYDCELIDLVWKLLGSIP